MVTLYFRCKLLSDIIINQKAASEGPNKTLDFIPGSNFMGIVAGALYEDKDNDAYEIVHSGKVRFGDAHPANGDSRTLRAPASMFSPKLEKSDEKKTYYIHHLVPDLSSDEMRKLQLKQQRGGFYDFSTKESKQVKTDTSFAIKSAYDNKTRRSADEQMYGYESLREGITMMFSVEVDNEKLADKVVKKLEGKKRVGRSRTAQYGLVEIARAKEEEYKEIKSTGNSVDVHGHKCVTVYAESRLIFLDEYGMPTFRPSEKHLEELGLKGGKIMWDMSQIRTFQYSPWNFKRQCFDTDRCGIEKGSVLVIEYNGDVPSTSKYVGSYKNEGFGRVIYNPDFLSADKDGVATYSIAQDKKKADAGDNDTNLSANIGKITGKSPILQYVVSQMKQEEMEQDVYQRVNKWVHDNKSLFKDEKFASQWGSIRSLAMQFSSLSTLKDKLFADNTGYLEHGVAAKKWKDQDRKAKFEEFFNDLNEANARLAIINLAAEMAKVIRRQGGDKNE